MMSIPPSIASPHHTSTFCSPLHSPRGPSASPSPRRRVSKATTPRSSRATPFAEPVSTSPTLDLDQQLPHLTPKKATPVPGRDSHTPFPSRIALSPSAHRHQRRASVQKGSAKDLDSYHSRQVFPMASSSTMAASTDPPSASWTYSPALPATRSNNLFAKDMAAAQQQQQATPLQPRVRKSSSTGAQGSRMSHAADSHYHYSLSTAPSQSPKWTRRRRQTAESSSGDDEEFKTDAGSGRSDGTGNPFDEPLESPISEADETQSDLPQLLPTSSASSLRSRQSSVPQKRTSHAAAALMSTPAVSFPSVHHANIRKPRSSTPMVPANPSQPPNAAHHDALEHHFAQVSMTPPANFGSHIQRESPFGAPAGGHFAHQPATDLRRQVVRLPRSSAYGSLSPLAGPDRRVEEEKLTGIKRTTRLDPLPDRQQQRLSLLDYEDDSSGTSADERPFESRDGAMSPSLLAAEQGRLRQEMRSGGNHARARTTGATSTHESHAVSGVALRRGKAPSFLLTKRDSHDGSHSMELDSDAEAGPPVSPSPLGDGSFSASGSGNLSSSADGDLLQPGPMPHSRVHRRSSLGGNLSHDPRIRTQYHGQQTISAPQLSETSPLGMAQLFPRYTPSTSFSASRTRHKKNPSSSSSSSSTGPPHVGSAAMKATKSASSSSPYKSKRRIATTDRGARTRAISAAAEQMEFDESINPFDSTSVAAPTGLGFDGFGDDLSFQAPTNIGRRPSTYAQHKMGLFSAPGSAYKLSTPGKSEAFANDDSGFAMASSPANDGLTPLRAGDQLLGNRLGFDDTPEKGLPLPRVSPSARKSSSCDSLASTPARPRPSATNHRGPFNPFGPIHRSSLANETSLMSTPNGTDSGASSPEHVGSQRTASVPEGLAVIDAQPAYLTPQNFKNIKPLQTAFMSTGLVSKKTRGPPSGADGDLAPLPPRPNFGNQSGGASATGPPNGSMAAAMGLREVVAATSARASLGATTGQSTMPDTPMKKPAAGSLAHHMMGSGLPSSSQRQPPPSVLRPTASSRSMRTIGKPPSFSPAQDDSSSTDGESPLLGGDACDSPTMNLVSVSNSGSNLASAKTPDDWPQFGSLPKEHDIPGQTEEVIQQANLARPSLPRTVATVANNSEDEGRAVGTSDLLAGERQPMRRTRTNAAGPAAPSTNSHRRLSRPLAARSISDQVAGTRHRSRLSDSQNSEHSNNSEGEGSVPSARPAFIRHRSRPSSGLQRKASFGVGAAEQQNGIGSPTFGAFVIPSTPTRNSGQIKWFEAARLVTTPSPPSRRQSKTSLKYAQGGSKSKSLKNGPTSSPLAAAAHSQVGRFESNFVQLSILGSGEFSEAVKAEEKSTGHVFAVKRMKRRFTGPKDRLRHLEEVDILRHLGSHSNVISLADAWEEDNHLFIQTELCPLGTLSFFLEGYGYLVGHLDEPRLWKVLAELASGVQHIHSHGVLHLDLKPANVFVTSVGSLKIGDFGLASRWPRVEQAKILAGADVGPVGLDDSGLGPVVGNQGAKPRRSLEASNLEREGDREYLAPEVMLDGEYSEAVDIFSLGLIMVEAVGNVILPDNGEPWQKLRNDDLSDVDFSHISISLYRLIQHMLSSTPSERPSVTEILSHPVMAAVQEKMRQGLSASELDQLPDFELPRKSSPVTLSTIESAGSLASNEGGSAASSGLASSSSNVSSSNESDKSAKVAGVTALGLTGVDSTGCAVAIRGALIQEDESFLSEVLARDPDVEARQLVPPQEHDGSVGDGSFTGLGLEAWTEEGESNMGDESYILGNHFADETFDQSQPSVWQQQQEADNSGSMDVDMEDVEDAFS
ncbi:unnamed protein product [Sympodiomycopsis kandeliae]